MITWLNGLPKAIPESGKNYLRALFDSSVDKGLNFIRKHREHQTVPAPDLSIVGTLCHILAAYTDFIDDHGGFGVAGETNSSRECRNSHISNSDLNEHHHYHYPVSGVCWEGFPTLGIKHLPKQRQCIL